MTSTPHTLGNFLDARLWREAHKLLNYQLQQHGRNHGFDTPSMFYYTRLSQVDRDVIGTASYFESLVASNVFYGLTSEFAARPYLVPKTAAVHRRYVFLTYPMRVLYYAVGLYLIKVSAEFLAHLHSSRPHLSSFYGGRLRFERDQVITSPKAILYYDHYRRFKSRLRKSAAINVENRVVIRLDVANFYDSVSIQRLLALLQRSIKASVQSAHGFDERPCEEILSFFRFAVGRDVGIPMFDNDVVSSAIGDLYLKFGDLACDDALRSHSGRLTAHEIVRYADDSFLILDFATSVGADERIETVYDVVARIADDYQSILGLSLNKKCEAYWLVNADDRKRLLSGLKRVSPNYYVNDDDAESPQNKVHCILDALDAVAISANEVLEFPTDVTNDVLREVFDSSVRQLLSMPIMTERLERVFARFNFNAVSRSAREITILLCMTERAKSRYRDFLLRRPCVTYRDANLILTFLCQTGFTDVQLQDVLSTHREMSELIKMFGDAAACFEYPGYFNTSRAACGRLAGMPHVVEQIKLRRLSEGSGSYAVALNHLLNEVHALARDVDPAAASGKEYKAEEAAAFCYSCGMPNETSIAFRNLFDLRNQNPVSHPGSARRKAIVVDPIQYSSVHASIGKGIPFLLSE